MADEKISISDKIEEFVDGAVRFISRFFLTLISAAILPVAFVRKIYASEDQKKFIAPNTFLILGCFSISVIIDAYPHGWQIYFNWIWLDAEIAKVAKDRSGQIFSIESVFRVGMPTFLALFGLTTLLAKLIAKSETSRDKFTAVLKYSFGFHVLCFSFACLIPIVASRSFPETNFGALLASQTASGVEIVLVIGLAGGCAIACFLSPVIAISSALLREFKSFDWVNWFWSTLLASASVVIAALIGSELGSLPARFSESLIEQKLVSYQVLRSLELTHKSGSDFLETTLDIILLNDSSDLAYVDGRDSLAHVLITQDALHFSPDVSNILLNAQGVATEVLALPPGESTRITLRSMFPWRDLPNTKEASGIAFYNSNAEVEIDYDLTAGVKTKGDLLFTFNSFMISEIQ